jgi:aldehyde:ferredoxin oxidoreductase
LDLRFGDSEIILQLIRKIALREGIGDILAEGVKIASERIGSGSDDLTAHVKGLESPAWGPRGSAGMGLAYMTGDRGGCHQRAFPIAWESTGEWPKGGKIQPTSLEQKVELVAWEQNLLASYYTLVSCEFARTGITTNIYLNMLREATGFEFTEDEFLKMGGRIWNRIRIYNIRNGITRNDDYLPKKFSEPLPSGPYQGHYFNMED